MSEEALDTSNFTSGEIENGVAPAAAEPEAVAAEGQSAEELAKAAEEEEFQREEAAKPKKTFQDRIDEVTRARREAEREAKYWRDVAEGRVQGQQNRQPEPQGPKPPNPDDFDLGDMDPRYLDAMVDYRVDLKLSSGLDKVRSEVAQSLHRQAGARVWEASQEAARAKFADYDEVVQPTDPVTGAIRWPLSDVAGEELQKMDAGGEVAYYLASHPEEAHRIYRLDPSSQLRELGRIEARLEMPSRPQAKAATDAPKPATSQARGAGGQFSPSPETDDFKAFEASYAAKW